MLPEAGLLRRYLQAHSVFKAEAQAKGLELTQTSSDNGMVEDLLFYLVADNEP